MSVNREVRSMKKSSIQEGWSQKCTRMVSKGKDVRCVARVADKVIVAWGVKNCDDSWWVPQL